MSKKKKILKIYQDENGNEPFIEWMESIKDVKTRDRWVEIKKHNRKI
ncbi:MAG: hypothetical protein GTO45_13420 [Candidatus Aminicenantes bacterium]|nr:hypothetical protein [Candidatus Aminicenantes bacterium]NIN19106.1 hypothetical protein [Candidatus Aminicenantes bacterium]NIN43008.1 hypothetical protein [Candidatus Aminicenantes bacterium]NIN85751.1 hypothetical protein [Candidatus Aminicenantes bacterium]NIO82009.1 hypothetical protein [Candidatus Aminicenantes bacterium]